MNSIEIEKSRTLTVVEQVGYTPNAMSTITILRKITGDIRLVSFDFGKGTTVHTSPFDTFVQIIEGCSVFVICGEAYVLETGQGIVIPAHQAYFIQPGDRMKMIIAIIKCGYESI